MQQQKDLKHFPAKPSSTSNQLDSLLVLRGLACLMVVIHHCSPPRKSILFQGNDLSWLMYSHGMVAVWIFFCLSGYLMGKAFYTERYQTNIQGVVNFWRNRAVRILPLYYFSVLILSIFAYPDVLRMENWGYLIRVLTFTYRATINYPPLIDFNWVLWSISTEVQFYIFVPFIYVYLRHRLEKKRHIGTAAFLIILAVFALRFMLWISLKNQIQEQFAYYDKYLYTPLLTNLDLFLCGFLVNALLKSSKKNETSLVPKNEKAKRRQKYFAVIIMVVYYFFTAYHLYSQELWNLSSNTIRTSTTIFILQPLTAMIVSFFIFAFESDSYQDFRQQQLEKLSFTSILNNPIRVLEVFGILSYGVYIWHQPILKKIQPIFSSNFPLELFYNRFILTLILSILLATVTYYLIEIPAARWKIYRSK